MTAVRSPHRGLDPTPEQAHDWLEQELNRSSYGGSWLDSAARWLIDHLRALVDSTGNIAGLSPVITVLVALVVVALLVWVLPKVRRELVAAPVAGAVLDDLDTTARTYRERAAQALKDGRFEDAVLDGFRAIAKDMDARTLLDEGPSSTAHEVSVALAHTFPEHADRLAKAADAFDLVRYGHRRATAGQAVDVQQLDAELVTTRPLLVTSRPQDLPV